MLARKTKRDVLAYCEEHGIELLDEDWRSGRHIHANAPDGRRFVISDCGSAGCWTGPNCDWSVVWAEVQLCPDLYPEDMT